MVTCFTRFIIALSFLRAGLGLQTTPPNMVLVSLALFMTFFVMAPTFDEAWQRGIRPFMENRITEQEAFTAVTQPFRKFMAANVREKDLKVFADLAQEKFGIVTDAHGLLAASASSMDELWLVLGLPPALVERSLPFLTIYNGAGEIDVLGYRIPRDAEALKRQEDVIRCARQPPAPEPSHTR
jgi:hypothetical protein